MTTAVFLLLAWVLFDVIVLAAWCAVIELGNRRTERATVAEAERYLSTH